MSDLLKRSFAPIVRSAWDEIDAQARNILKGNLSARTLVDFDGPKGWTLSAVNLGRVTFNQKESLIPGSGWGLREVLPLIELRVLFKLSIKELDDIERGLKNPDFDSLDEACRKTALFEERAIYYGLKKAGIDGLLAVTPHKSIDLNKDPENYQEIIETGIVTLQKNGIGGPYNLVLGSLPYQLLQQGDKKGYPLYKRIKDILRGDILWSPAVEGGALISCRGGDYAMTVGQDLSIGYLNHDPAEVELFVTESFTFQVFEPAAALEFKLKS